MDGRTRLLGGLLSIAVLGGLLVGAVGPATASASTGVEAAGAVVLAKAPALTREQRLAQRVNHARTNADRKPYRVVSTLSAVAEKQARRMATKQTLYHNPHLTTDVHQWVAIGENVAYASSVKAAHRLLMNSPPHRANLLSRTFTQVGLGVVKDGHGRYWVCEVFRRP